MLHYLRHGMIAIPLLFSAIHIAQAEEINSSCKNDKKGCPVVFAVEPTISGLTTGTCSTPLDVTYTVINSNVPVPVTLNSIIFSPNNTGVTIVPTPAPAISCVAGDTLTPGAECDITLRFQICEAGPLIGQLIIDLNTSQGSLISDINTNVEVGNVSGCLVLGGSTGTGVSNTGNSVIEGNVCTAPGNTISGFPPGTALGFNLNDAIAQQALINANALYNILATLPCTNPVPFPGGQIPLSRFPLAPGVYCTQSFWNFQGTGLMLSGAGLYVFRSTAAPLTTTLTGVFTFQNGANPANLFWQNAGPDTFGLLATNPPFYGNVVSQGDVNFSNAEQINGEVVSLTGTVFLEDNLVQPLLGSCTILGATQVTNAGPLTSTQVISDVCVSPGNTISGFGTATLVNGVTRSNDTVAQVAHADVSAQFITLADPVATLCQHFYASGVIPQVDFPLNPGIYCSGTGSWDLSAATSTPTLAGFTSATDSYVFRTDVTQPVGSITTPANFSIGLNALFPSANKIFWIMTGAGTTNVQANGPFLGNIFANNNSAASNIVLANGISTTGQIVSLNGSVSVSNNLVIP